MNQTVETTNQGGVASAKPASAIDYRFSVAPMMEWTDRHCRFFHRLMSRRARLYTEMVTAPAVIHGPRERLLGFAFQEQPVAVQLGGSDGVQLSNAARICEDFGYGEVNLNVGCPSDRVQDGRFGACLMREPGLVGELVSAMKQSVAVPVTVKCRIGVDDQEPEEALNALVDTVVAAGADAVIVHARMAWLEGLSPKENRDVPPLDYGIVYRLKERLPDLPIAINGGIADLDQSEEHLRNLDGVMLGRAAYHTPALMLDVDARLFGEKPPLASAREAAELMIPYIERHIAEGGRLANVTRHMLGLFHNMPGARAYRRHLAENAHRPGAGAEVLREALGLVREFADSRAA